MDKLISPTTDFVHTFPIPPQEDRERSDSSSVDSSGLVTRGVGRCLGKYFPHLLKNNFNKVLLVDDDPELHVGFGQVLTNAGYFVQHTISELDAIQIIKENPPDFLVTNWRKPLGCSLPFFESLRRGTIDRYLYIIVMASDDCVRDKVQIIASGADAFMVKPVKDGEMLSILQAGIRIIEEQLRLKELAMHDPLTGLLNKRTFAELHKQEWSRATRHEETVSCAMIDIDYFKNINDLFGNVHGDRVLCRIGEIMKSIGRKSDILCRIGEDEFCIFMPNTDLRGALVCAERFRKAVEAEKKFFAESEAFPTVTIGVATKTDEMDSSDSLLEKADQSLVWAKQNSRNTVATYDIYQAAIAAFREKAY